MPPFLPNPLISQQCHPIFAFAKWVITSQCQPIVTLLIMLIINFLTLFFTITADFFSLLLDAFQKMSQKFFKILTHKKKN